MNSRGFVKRVSLALVVVMLFSCVWVYSANGTGNIAEDGVSNRISDYSPYGLDENLPANTLYDGAIITHKSVTDTLLSHLHEEDDDYADRLTVSGKDEFKVGLSA